MVKGGWRQSLKLDAGMIKNLRDSEKLGVKFCKDEKDDKDTIKNCLIENMIIKLVLIYCNR